MMTKFRLLIPLLAIFFAGPSLAKQKPLRILIVNDDGCQAFGSVNLQKRLADRGHDVWLVAPTQKQKTAGTSTTNKLNKTFNFNKISVKHYCFSGTPSDSLDFALTGLMAQTPPDLIISGVSYGPSTAAYFRSGVMANAMTALSYGYPTIAASIGFALTENEKNSGWPSTKRHWGDSLEYLVDQVEILSKNWQDGQPLMPIGTGININYPPVPKDQIKGIKYTQPAYPVEPQVRYRIHNNRATQLSNELLFQPPRTRTDSDDGWLVRRYVTHSVFSIDNQDIKATEKAFQKLLTDPD